MIATGIGVGHRRERRSSRETVSSCEFVTQIEP